MQYTHKSTLNSLRGRSNRAEGLSFEELVSRSCDYYREREIADIEKTPEPFKAIGRTNSGGKFIGYFERKAQPDFKGTLKGGKSIVFDAKSTITDRIAVSVLSDEQRKHLILHDRLGAKSGVLMCFSFRYFFFIPIKTFLNAKELNGHAHWTVHDAALHGETVRHTGTILDFLGGIEWH